MIDTTRYIHDAIKYFPSLISFNFPVSCSLHGISQPEICIIFQPACGVGWANNGDIEWGRGRQYIPVLSHTCKELQSSLVTCIMRAPWNWPCSSCSYEFLPTWQCTCAVTRLWLDLVTKNRFPLGALNQCILYYSQVSASHIPQTSRKLCSALHLNSRSSSCFQMGFVNMLQIFNITWNIIFANDNPFVDYAWGIMNF